MPASTNYQRLLRSSHDVFQRFRKIEPKAWNKQTLLLELHAEIGSLIHAILDIEGYKVGAGNLEKIKNEAADVLFIALRILDQYPNPTLPNIAVDHAPEIEEIVLEIANAGSKLYIDVNTDKANLAKIISLLDLLAEHYCFSLERSYLYELRKCRLWQFTFLYKHFKLSTRRK